jgi:3-isopropylmalate/(R)-2-methylmalate dehydratase small subunit
MQGRAIVISGDDIDTDVLYPGTFLDITDVEQMTHHLFEGLDPALRSRLGGDTALMVGSNFGCGSSREHVPQAMRASGVRFLVGAGFARIFYRNCINLGLPVVVSEAAVAAATDDSTVELDLEDGSVVVDATRFALTPVPPFMREIFAAGGLIPWMRRQREVAG